jgi:hypothetical protein
MVSFLKTTSLKSSLRAVAAAAATSAAITNNLMLPECAVLAGRELFIPNPLVFLHYLHSEIT